MLGSSFFCTESELFIVSVKKWVRHSSYGYTEEKDCLRSLFMGKRSARWLQESLIGLLPTDWLNLFIRTNRKGEKD